MKFPKKFHIFMTRVIIETVGLQLVLVTINIVFSQVASTPSAGTFKRRYMDFYQITANPVYVIHKPVGHSLLARLRVGLSHFREHKFNHHFKESENPYFQRDSVSVESVEHYPLRCSNHASSRISLLEHLISIIRLISLERILVLPRYSFMERISFTPSRIKS